MLTDDVDTGSRTQRTARRRRPLLLFVLLAGVVWLAREGVSLDHFDVPDARRTARRAAWLLADGGHVADLERRISEADAATAAELALPPWKRDAERVERLWVGVLEAANQALSQARQERLQARHRWQALEPRAAAAVRRAREQARTPGLGRFETRLAEEAGVSLGQARRLAAGGEHDAAVTLAEAALAHSTTIAERHAALHAPFSDAAQIARWRSWVDATLAESRRSGMPAVIVDKLARRLDLYRGGRKVASFQVELGSGGLVRKLYEGDLATPEGRYKVLVRKSGRQTRYYKALLLDYPNAEDRARYVAERARGNVPAGSGIGGLIEIHGHGGQGSDWTQGCIALPDAEIDRLFEWAPVGTLVTIVGTTGTASQRSAP